MWTEPKHFKAWYGPDGATIPVAKMDVPLPGTTLDLLWFGVQGNRVRWNGIEYH